MNIGKCTKIFERIMLNRTSSNIINPQELKSKLKELNDKYSKLVEDNLLGRLSDIKFQKECQKIHEEIVKLGNLLNTLLLEQSNKELLKKRFNHFVTHMDVSNKDKLELIKICVKAIIVSKENDENTIRVIYKFE